MAIDPLKLLLLRIFGAPAPPPTTPLFGSMVKESYLLKICYQNMFNTTGRQLSMIKWNLSTSVLIIRHRKTYAIRIYMGITQSCLTRTKFRGYVKTHTLMLAY